jgi:hypothetical protein
MTASTAEKPNEVVQIMYDHFMEQTHSGKKAAAMVNYMGQKVQEPGCKLIHLGKIVFLITVSGPHMVEMHAMIGKGLSESAKLKELDKQLDPLIAILKNAEVKVLYTYMPLNKKQVFEKILREYKFKEEKIKGPDGKPYISFFIEV